MAIKEELSLDTPWALGEEVFEVILSELELEYLDCFLEFGSGISSIRFGKKLSSTEIYSLEHDLEYLKKNRKLLKEYGCINVQICQAPLAWQFIDGRLYKSYKVESLPSDVDAVLIDGPPYWTRRGREFCLYKVYDRLKIGGKVFLDDSLRPSEKRIVSNWTKIYPGSFEIEIFEIKNGLTVLTKVKNVKRRVLSISVIADNLIINMRHLLAKIIK